jgi:3-isopropylmalate/(R)-2-methylmalate dehydratase small subunit
MVPIVFEEFAMRIRGECLVLGNDINTDVIIPSMYCNSPDAVTLGRHCFAHVDPGFSAKAASSQVLLAGKNFGCGSSREHAPLALFGAGIRCILGISFARIFFRNSINIGLPVFMVEDLVNDASPGDGIEIDIPGCYCVNTRLNRRYALPLMPPEIDAIFRSGGLVGYYRAHHGRDMVV